MARVVMCDVCGCVGEEERYTQIGFDLREIRIALTPREVVEATQVRDLCVECYVSLLRNFKSNPVVIQETE